MDRDARKRRGEQPFLFTDLRHGDGLPEVVDWVRRQVAHHAAGHAPSRCELPAHPHAH